MPPLHCEMPPCQGLLGSGSTRSSGIHNRLSLSASLAANHTCTPPHPEHQVSRAPLPIPGRVLCCGQTGKVILSASRSQNSSGSSGLSLDGLRKSLWLEAWRHQKGFALRHAVGLAVQMQPVLHSATRPPSFPPLLPCSSSSSSQKLIVSLTSLRPVLSRGLCMKLIMHR